MYNKGIIALFAFYFPQLLCPRVPQRDSVTSPPNLSGSVGSFLAAFLPRAAQVRLGQALMYHIQRRYEWPTGFNKTQSRSFVWLPCCRLSRTADGFLFRYVLHDPAWWWPSWDLGGCTGIKQHGIRNETSKASDISLCSLIWEAWSVTDPRHGLHWPRRWADPVVVPSRAASIFRRLVLAPPTREFGEAQVSNCWPGPICVVRLSFHCSWRGHRHDVGALLQF
jgi:hypothetical protein